MPTEYQAFVAKNFARMPGKCAPCDRMKRVAAAWRERNGSQRGRGASSVNEDYVPRQSRLQGGYVNFRGGSAMDSLRAANQGDPDMVGGNWKSDAKDAWRDFKYGFMIPVRAAAKVLPFVL
jgi:hypothetical protein